MYESWTSLQGLFMKSMQLICKSLPFGILDVLNLPIIHLKQSLAPLIIKVKDKVTLGISNVGIPEPLSYSQGFH